MINIFRIEKENKFLLLTDFVISRFFLFIFLFMAWGTDLVGLWDCEHYIHIAYNGYTDDYLYAFFPLIPLLIRLIGPFGVVILNQILSIILAYIFLDVSKNILKDENSIFAARLWLWSPIAVFTLICYTETLFIFLTLISFYLYKKKKYYVLLGFLLGLSVMCRNTGSLLFFTLFGFMFFDFIKKKESILNIFKVYIPATIISCIYPIYLQIVARNWKIFVDIQYSFWQKSHCNFFTLFTKISTIEKAPSITKPLFYFDYIFIMCFLVFILYLIIKNIKKVEYSEMLVFLFLSFLAITSTCKYIGNPVASYYRYLFGTFPLFFVLPKKKWILNISMIFSQIIGLLFIFSIYYY